MQLTEISYKQAVAFEGYGPGFFRIGGQVLSGPICVSTTRAVPWGGYEDVETLLSLAGDIDVLFVGTGGQISQIPATLRNPLEEAGIGVEIMDSPAACRTYNVLLSEARRVAVALMPV